MTDSGLPTLLQDRFGGTARLYGQLALNRFSRAHVVVVGLGGVGSWVVEALARSAVGRLTLIDLDIIHESNINRQLQASSETLGQDKGAALKARVATINPGCQVTLVDDFVSADNLEALLPGDAHWVIDCIDSFRVKAAMIAWCKRRKVKILTLGGAGGMTDPQRLRAADLARSEQDPLLARVRRLLRSEFGFPQDSRKRFEVPCIYSDEPVRYPQACDLPAASDGRVTGLNCASGFGSAVVVTATAGMQAAAYVLNKLADGVASRGVSLD